MSCVDDYYDENEDGFFDEADSVVILFFDEMDSIKTKVFKEMNSGSWGDWTSLRGRLMPGVRLDYTRPMDGSPASDIPSRGRVGHLPRRLTAVPVGTNWWFQRTEGVRDGQLVGGPPTTAPHGGKGSVYEPLFSACMSRRSPPPLMRTRTDFVELRATIHWSRHSVSTSS